MHVYGVNIHFHFISLYLFFICISFYFYFLFFEHHCGTDVMVLRDLLISSSGMKYRTLSENVWQVVFANIFA